MHSMSSKSSIAFETEGGAVDIGLAHDASQHHMHKLLIEIFLSVRCTLYGIGSHFPDCGHGERSDSDEGDQASLFRPSLSISPLLSSPSLPFLRPIASMQVFHVSLLILSLTIPNLFVHCSLDGWEKSWELVCLRGI